uniref:Uncharacterized protein n=1 Tax=Chromera velia CCMP2878 TaxID=1169474 RepID=A0A0G4FBI3_9ALVE|eukprot:Cvel_16145.t1-p1 / transcript=Cvel_16145.t1 / gene=Cvel_16145 / organism=Chromera_velia_CCMP2878 / gene_product=hypothetical protein / transcript_product=hypothetical protein / location=Cvel_scaffold1229:36285-38941(-) / protein_length=713 / sequence_SO=supercontig / SO=protein_coding / is_pseudo=false
MADDDATEKASNQSDEEDSDSDENEGEGEAEEEEDEDDVQILEQAAVEEAADAKRAGRRALVIDLTGDDDDALDESPHLGGASAAAAGAVERRPLDLCDAMEWALENTLQMIKDRYYAWATQAASRLRWQIAFAQAAQALGESSVVEQSMRAQGEEAEEDEEQKRQRQYEEAERFLSEMISEKEKTTLKELYMKNSDLKHIAYHVQDLLENGVITKAEQQVQQIKNNRKETLALRELYVHLCQLVYNEVKHHSPARRSENGMGGSALEDEQERELEHESMATTKEKTKPPRACREDKPFGWEPHPALVGVLTGRVKSLDDFFVRFTEDNPQRASRRLQGQAEPPIVWRSLLRAKKSQHNNLVEALQGSHARLSYEESALPTSSKKRRLTIRGMPWKYQDGYTEAVFGWKSDFAFAKEKEARERQQAEEAALEKEEEEEEEADSEDEKEEEKGEEEEEEKEEEDSEEKAEEDEPRDEGGSAGLVQTKIPRAPVSIEGEVPVPGQESLIEGTLDKPLIQLPPQFLGEHVYAVREFGKILHPNVVGDVTAVKGVSHKSRDPFLPIGWHVLAVRGRRREEGHGVESVGGKRDRRGGCVTDASEIHALIILDAATAEALAEEVSVDQRRREGREKKRDSHRDSQQQQAEEGEGAERHVKVKREESDSHPVRNPSILIKKEESSPLRHPPAAAAAALQLPGGPPPLSSPRGSRASPRRG